MIKPWIFEFFNTFGPPGAEIDAERRVALYDWHMELWTRAEVMGFEGVFFSEHHFAHGFFSPSPNLLIAAVAARTSRLRLGVMGQVLPLYDPFRVVEENGMLDHISHGRLEIGFSNGFGPGEPQKVGIPRDEIRPRFEEMLDILDAAFETGRISHHGRFWNYDDLVVSPPLLQTRPNRWITATNPASAEAIARRGYNICTGFLDVKDVKGLFDAYNAAAQEAGKPWGPQTLGLRRQILIADTDAQAQALADQAREALQAPAQAAPDAPAPARHGPFFGADEAISGSPDSVAEQIIEQCRATGAGHIMAYLFRTLTIDAADRSYALWDRVIPKLRSAQVA